MTDRFDLDLRDALLHISHALELNGMNNKWCEVYLKIQPNKDGYNFEFIRVYEHMEEENSVKCVLNLQTIRSGNNGA